MDGHVYHWKHGWIPLTHYAALVKAHGSHKGAAKFLNDSNGHHGSESSRVASASHGGFPTGQHVVYNGRLSDGTGTVEGSRNHGGETFLAVRDHKDGKVYEWAPNQVAALPHDGAGSAGHGAPAKADTAAGGSRRTSAELRAAADAKRAEADRAGNSAGFGDTAAGRLSGPGLKQFHKSTDASMKRYIAAQQQARNLEHKAALQAAREKEAARTRYTHDEIKGATHVKDSTGWHEVVRVNAKSVTVKTPYSWTDTIPHDKIHAIHKGGPR